MAVSGALVPTMRTTLEGLRYSCCSWFSREPPSKLPAKTTITCSRLQGLSSGVKVQLLQPVSREMPSKLPATTCSRPDR